MGTFLFIVGTAIIVSGLIVLLVPEDKNAQRNRPVTGIYTINDFVVQYRQGVCVCLVLIGAFVIFSGFDLIVRSELERAKDSNRSFEVAQVAFHAKMRESYIEDALRRSGASLPNVQ